MCLLVVLHRVHPDSPLVVAANRDEFLARPAVAMTVLQREAPRILGGQDQVAGGTWLAVNEHGVFAGITNLPSPGGRDPSKRSRGELPLILARQANAQTAVEAFAGQVRPADYNPAWLLTGDRRSLYYLDVTGKEAPKVVALKPGVHILENKPLDAPSAKIDRVRNALSGVLEARGEALVPLLEEVLRGHEGKEPACVHAGPYGTRSATVIVAPPSGGRPLVRFSPGPPCTTAFSDASGLWREG